jgi:hypothetical protein
MEPFMTDVDTERRTVTGMRGDPMKIRKLMGIAVITLIGVSILAGCTLEPDRLTRDNYDRLKTGMSFAEAVEILGQPATEATWLGLRQYTWVEKDRHIHIKFLAGHAIYFSSKNLEAVQTERRRLAGH